MNITERLNAIRTHCRHREFESCGDCDHIDEHLDVIEAELAAILQRLPAAPDTTPTHITLTAS